MSSYGKAVAQRATSIAAATPKAPRTNTSSKTSKAAPDVALVARNHVGTREANPGAAPDPYYLHALYESDQLPLALARYGTPDLRLAAQVVQERNPGTKVSSKATRAALIGYIVTHVTGTSGAHSASTAPKAARTPRAPKAAATTPATAAATPKPKAPSATARAVELHTAYRQARAEKTAAVTGSNPMGFHNAHLAEQQALAARDAHLASLTPAARAKADAAIAKADAGGSATPRKRASRVTNAQNA